MSVIWNESAVFRKRCSQVSGKTHNAHPADPKKLLHQNMERTEILANGQTSPLCELHSKVLHRPFQPTELRIWFSAALLSRMTHWCSTYKYVDEKPLPNLYITSPSSKGFPTQRQHEQSTRLSPFLFQMAPIWFAVRSKLKPCATEKGCRNYQKLLRFLHNATVCRHCWWTRLGEYVFQKLVG